jgi:hypothetical protein
MRPTCVSGGSGRSGKLLLGSPAQSLLVSIPAGLTAICYYHTTLRVVQLIEGSSYVTWRPKSGIVGPEEMAVPKLGKQAVVSMRSV